MYTGTGVTEMYLRRKGGKRWYLWQGCFTRLVWRILESFFLFLVYHWCGNQDEFPQICWNSLGTTCVFFFFCFGTAPTLSWLFEFPRLVSVTLAWLCGPVLDSCEVRWGDPSAWGKPVKGTIRSAWTSNSTNVNVSISKALSCRCFLQGVSLFVMRMCVSGRVESGGLYSLY